MFLFCLKMVLFLSQEGLAGLGVRRVRNAGPPAPKKGRLSSIHIERSLQVMKIAQKVTSPISHFRSINPTPIDQCELALRPNEAFQARERRSIERFPLCHRPELQITIRGRQSLRNVRFHAILRISGHRSDHRSRNPRFSGLLPAQSFYLH